MQSQMTFNRPFELTVTWYKIRHAGGQAYYYSRTGTAKQCYFILSSLNFLCFGCPSAGIIISLPSSMALVAKGLLGVFSKPLEKINSTKLDRAEG